MQDFLTKDFMLHTETARQLFCDYAREFDSLKKGMLKKV